MKFFQKMERKFGRYAIHNLMYYIIMLYVVGFVILKFAPELYYYYLMLDAPSILHGQVWRLVTFMIFPPTTSFIWILLLLLMYYSLGSSLERVWGAFRFNVYVFMGDPWTYYRGAGGLFCDGPQPPSDHHVSQRVRFSGLCGNVSQRVFLPLFCDCDPGKMAGHL